MALYWKLHGALGKVDWRDADAAEATGAALRRLGVDFLREIYVQAISNRWSLLGRRTRLLSVRKPTHYKWYLGGADPNLHQWSRGKRRYAVWVHDYGVPMPHRGPYIDYDHNHRSPFTSEQIGEEGFVEHRLSPPRGWQPTEGGFWMPSEEDWLRQERRIYRPGDVCVMPDCYTIHRVEPNPRAITFVVQGPRQRTESQVFKDGQVLHYPDNRGQALESVNQLRRRQGLSPLSLREFIDMR